MCCRMRVIDAFVSCYPHRDIDVLALDRQNRLAVIDLETDTVDSLVVRGLAHCDWLQHNLPNVRRMYPGSTIASSFQPRLFLVAFGFSPLALGAARQLTHLQIHWFKYHAFEMGSATAVFFDPLT